MAPGRYPIDQLAAFGDGPFSGNPAAVVRLPEWLADTVLQAIAAENNLAETAFLVERPGRRELRWFTPSCEVELCGHATLATAAVLFTQTGAVSPIRFQTRSGELAVAALPDGRLELDFPCQVPRPCHAPAELTRALGTPLLDVRRAANYLVRLADEAAVRALAPDMTMLARLGAFGVIATAPGETADYVARYFAPQFGVPEDPATGSSHCMLAPYWQEQLGGTAFSARQLSARGGWFACRLVEGRVRIAGHCVPYLRGEVML
ncbi:MAG TPA: PhzF family phenazine biosynthesis protein [Gammaproteobacteria bacterium]|nr:PhzF family phenazine biosynthesis protein [Gammaproteobacteria bacterium]